MPAMMSGRHQDNQSDGMGIVTQDAAFYKALRARKIEEKAKMAALIQQRENDESSTSHNSEFTK